MYPYSSNFLIPFHPCLCIFELDAKQSPRVTVYASTSPRQPLSVKALNDLKVIKVKSDPTKEGPYQIWRTYLIGFFNNEDLGKN